MHDVNGIAVFIDYRGPVFVNLYDAFRITATFVYDLGGNKWSEFISVSETIPNDVRDGVSRSRNGAEVEDLGRDAVSVQNDISSIRIVFKAIRNCCRAAFCRLPVDPLSQIPIVLPTLTVLSKEGRGSCQEKSQE